MVSTRTNWNKICLSASFLQPPLEGGRGLNRHRQATCLLNQLILEKGCGESGDERAIDTLCVSTDLLPHILHIILYDLALDSAFSLAQCMGETKIKIRNV